jgi:hypothetical protein
MDGTSSASQARTERSIRADEPSRAEYSERLRALSDLAYRRDPDVRDSSSGDAMPHTAKSADYWSEVSRFEREAENLRSRHPADAPAGKPRASDAGRPETQPESDVRDAIDRVREREADITADIQKIATDSPSGLWLEGLDFRLKGEARLREKVAEQVKAEPDRTPDDMVRSMPDAVRYTFCGEDHSYAAGFGEVKQRLQAEGYHMSECRNFWSNTEYKGINTRWETSDGQRFEVQFHTPESFHAKQELTHWAYERLRLPRSIVGRAERQELLAFEREVSSRINVPGGALDIPDYKKDG